MKVTMIDLLCVSPYYDIYLCRALQKVCPSIDLASISFHLDVGGKKKYGVRNSAMLIDLVARSRIVNDRLRQALKVLEYGANLVSHLIGSILSPPDLLHVQWLPFLEWSSIEVWWLRLLKKRNIRMVYTVHNVFPHDSEAGKKYNKNIVRVFDTVDALIVHTHMTKKRLCAEFGVLPDKVRVIPLGPFFHDSRPVTRSQARIKLGLPDGALIALMLGTVKPYKGIEFLLKSWQTVTRECDNIILVLAGSGDQGYMEKISASVPELGLEKSVRTFFRPFTTDEIILFHSASDMVVLPYKDITQSAALFTAMAFGKAIIATAVGGFTETLKDGKTALLVDYDDSGGLASAILRLAGSPEEMTALGSGALEELKVNYSWDRIAQMTMECYMSVSTAHGS